MEKGLENENPVHKDATKIKHDNLKLLKLSFPFEMAMLY